MSEWPQSVKIVEVGPRDGLQNEARTLTTQAKLAFIRQLAAAGLPEIEAGAFVRADRIPQLADSEAVFAALKNDPAPPVYTALVPNMRGLERAIANGVRRIAVFTAASDAFTRSNINQTIAQSLETFGPIIQTAQANGISVRGYVSTVVACPYAGEIAPQAVFPVVQALLDLGVDEVSLGETLGVASPKDITALLEVLLAEIPASRLALHCHNTYGMGLANVVEGMRMGLTTFDTSAGGLGGCPYAPGAAGNLSTEDLLYLLDRMGVHTGVDRAKVKQASEELKKSFGK